MKGPCTFFSLECIRTMGFDMQDHSYRRADFFFNGKAVIWNVALKKQK